MVITFHKDLLARTHALQCRGKRMSRLEACVATASVSLVVVVGSLLVMTHNFVLPRLGGLEDTLNLIGLMRQPTAAIPLLSSSLTQLTSLLLSVNELLRPWDPLLNLLVTLLLFFITLVVAYYYPPHSTSRTQASPAITCG